jgi:hypothetical protein
MSLARNTLVQTSFTLLSRVLGYARDRAISNVIGASAIGDAFATLMSLADNAASPYYQIGLVDGTTGKGAYLARKHDGTLSQQAMLFAAGLQSRSGIGGYAYPLPSIGGLAVHPMFISDGGLPRGRLPGLYQVLQNGAGAYLDTARVIIDGTSRPLMIVDPYENGSAGRVAIDLQGPWR